MQFKVEEAVTEAVRLRNVAYGKLLEIFDGGKFSCKKIGKQLFAQVQYLCIIVNCKSIVHNILS